MSIRDVGTLTSSRKLDGLHNEMTPIGRTIVASEAVEIKLHSVQSGSMSAADVHTGELNSEWLQLWTECGFHSGFAAVAIPVFEERTWPREKGRSLG